MNHLDIEAESCTHNNGSDRKFANDLREIVKTINPHEKIIRSVSITDIEND